MSWVDRLQTTSYTSPSGKSATFAYENIAESVDKRTTAFDFIDFDGTYVQDLGPTGRRYPWRLFFSGEDHDEEATAFLDLLTEVGIGKLVTPLYGTKNVVPFGKIDRRDDLKTAANQTVIEVAFWESITDILPSNESDSGSAVLLSIDQYNVAAASEFAGKISTVTASEQFSFKDKFDKALGAAKGALQKVADAKNAVARTFKNIADSIDKALDILVSTPLTLAFQLGILLQEPARALRSIKARLDSGRNLFRSLFSSGSGAGSTGGNSGGLGDAEGGGVGGGGPLDAAFIDLGTGSLISTEAGADVTAALDAYSELIDVFTVGENTVQTPGTDAQNANAFFIAELFASGAVSGAVLSVVTTQFDTQPDALIAAEKVIELFDQVTEWRDANYQSLGAVTPPLTVSASLPIVDTGEAYQQLQQAVALTVGFLVRISFSLKQERSVVLDRARTIVDLSAELYGVVDSRLDTLINTNNLSGSDIRELPRGRTVVYYI